MSTTGFVLVRKNQVVHPTIYGSEGQARYWRETDYPNWDDVEVARVYLP